MGKLHPLVKKVFDNAGIDPKTLDLSGTHPQSPDGTLYFVKTGPIANLKAEHESLVALSKFAPPGFVPRSLGITADGQTNASEGEGGMVSEYFELGGRKSQRELGLSLAKVHTYNTEIKQFGFGVPTFCGITEQDNTWKNSWKEFYVENRAGELVRRLKDPVISKEWDKMLQKAIPLLLDDISPVPRPVVVHGDLWSGNVSTNTKTGQPVIFDPSSCYAHNEYELGICHMFGGFTKDFFDAYHSVHPRSTKYYDERLKLYELYHHLNHALMFGGGYKSSAIGIMRDLIAFAERAE